MTADEDDPRADGKVLAMPRSRVLEPGARGGRLSVVAGGGRRGPIDPGRVAGPGDEANRRKAIRLIKDGILTPADVAALLSLSEEFVLRWCRAARVDWIRARMDRAQKEWDAR